MTRSSVFPDVKPAATPSGEHRAPDVAFDHRPTGAHQMPGSDAVMPVTAANACAPALWSSADAQAVIHVIEDNPAVREATRILFEDAGWVVQDHASAEAFLGAPRPAGFCCLVVDVMLPGMTGVKLLETLRAEERRYPAIMVTGRGDAATAVAALKAGAADFIEKPADRALLLTAVTEALAAARDARAKDTARARAKARFDRLSLREREVLGLVLDGHASKSIAFELGITQRTVETHRARVMLKTGARSLPALVKLHIAAQRSDQGSPRAAD